MHIFLRPNSSDTPNSIALMTYLKNYINCFFMKKTNKVKKKMSEVKKKMNKVKKTINKMTKKINNMKKNIV